MNSKNSPKKSNGFSLLEAMAAIAITGFLMSALINLLFALMQTTQKKHISLGALLSLKNFWYETERSRLMHPEEKKAEFIKAESEQASKLKIEIKKNDLKNKSLDNVENLEIIVVTAINNLEKTTLEKQLLFFKVQPPKIEKETEKEKGS